MIAGHRLPQRSGNRALLLGRIRNRSELGRLVIQPKLQELHAAHSEHNSVFEPHKQRVAAQLNVGPELDESLRKDRFLDRIGGNDVDAVGRLDFNGLHEEQEGSENIFDRENRLVDRLSESWNLRDRFKIEMKQEQRRSENLRTHLTVREETQADRVHHPIRKGAEILVFVRTDQRAIHGH